MLKIFFIRLAHIKKVIDSGVTNRQYIQKSMLPWPFNVTRATIFID